jgi:hypothetical protein
MAGISKIRELEARKRALVAESERCREALKAEVENLKLYGAGFVHTFDRLRSAGPWLKLAGSVAFPVLGFILGKRTKTSRPSRLKSAIATTLLGFRLYRKYGFLIKSMVSRFQLKRGPVSEARSTSPKS